MIIPDAIVHCFEPAKETFKKLVSNNFPANVTLNNFGVSDEDSESELYYDREGSGLASLYNGNLIIML